MTEILSVVHYYQLIIITQKLLSLKIHVIYFKMHRSFRHGLKVSLHCEVLPNPSGVARKVFPSLIWLSIKIKFKYQPEEKEIDVVEELELYSLMMSKWCRQTSRVRALVFCHSYKLYNCCTQFFMKVYKD